MNPTTPLATNDPSSTPFSPGEDSRLGALTTRPPMGLGGTSAIPTPDAAARHPPRRWGASLLGGVGSALGAGAGVAAGLSLAAGGASAMGVAMLGAALGAGVGSVAASMIARRPGPGAAARDPAPLPDRVTGLPTRSEFLASLQAEREAELRRHRAHWC